VDYQKYLKKIETFSFEIFIENYPQINGDLKTFSLFIKMNIIDKLSMLIYDHANTKTILQQFFALYHD